MKLSFYWIQEQQSNLNIKNYTTTGSYFVHSCYQLYVQNDRKEHANKKELKEKLSKRDGDYNEKGRETGK